ncbi:MAG: V-type ATP synthase subunit D [Candidatus Omnitrophica bacterium]|nr:V-type ATP synthase subunit D [Candidatus Omnitrophota bacterium]MCB9719657.1 V-type ATP synthase subunit D [Candidatus Omnitrophota bacterium]
MAKIKLTKGELKRQRDSLKQFKRYLPTLQLKKQQLQMRTMEVRKHLEHRLSALYEKDGAVKKWAGLLGDAGIDLKPWINPKDIKCSTTNVAGATVPVFEDISYETAEYDFYETPLWVDKALEELRLTVKMIAEVEVVKKQIAILEHELRTTTQRVNLFEKVKIPECQENIRKIRIYLGDQQAHAVGVSKVAKKKVIDKEELALADS